MAPLILLLRKSPNWYHSSLSTNRKVTGRTTTEMVTAPVDQMSEKEEEIFKCLDCRCILECRDNEKPSSCFCDFCKPFNTNKTKNSKSLTKVFFTIMTSLLAKNDPVEYGVLLDSMVETHQWNKEDAKSYVKKMISTFIIFEFRPNYFRFVAAD